MWWTAGERRILTILGVLALTGLGVLAWQQHRAPLRIEQAPVPEVAARWDQALAQARQVDVNQADVAELERLPGVGPALAGRIVAYRAQHGPFAAIDDVARVSGIGPKTLAALADHLTLDSSDATPHREP